MPPPHSEEVLSQAFAKDSGVSWMKYTKEAREKYWSVKSCLWQFDLTAFSEAGF